jgi:DNA polymerase-3 subunit epsilon
MKKLLYLDLETTGLDPKTNSIHEIGAIVEIDGFVAGEFEIKLKQKK